MTSTPSIITALFLLLIILNRFGDTQSQPDDVVPDFPPPLIVVQTPVPLPACLSYNTTGQQSAMTIMHTFDTTNTLGTPTISWYQTLTLHDGYLYGTDQRSNNHTAGGALFRISTDGSNYTLFDLSSGSKKFTTPVLGVTAAKSGLLIGASLASGVWNTGGSSSLYAFNATNGTFSDLYLFPFDTPSEAYTQVITSRNGLIVGTGIFLHTINGLYTVDQVNQTNTSLRTYLFNGTDIGAVRTGVVEGQTGVYYGATDHGCSNHYGCLYMVNTSQPAPEAVTVLHAFSNATGNGYSPFCELIFGSADNVTLYGTTTSGGIHGGGTIFTYNTVTHQYADVYHFDWHSDIGSTPDRGLLLAGDGRMYGATGHRSKTGDGVIFSFSPRDVAGTISVVHVNGVAEYGVSKLVDDGAGHLYGVTGNNIFSLQYNCHTLVDQPANSGPPIVIYDRHH